MRCQVGIGAGSHVVDGRAVAERGRPTGPSSPGLAGPDLPVCVRSTHRYDPPRADPAAPVMLRPPAALPPPTGSRAGWYRDPYGFPLMRYHDGRAAGPQHTTGVLTAKRDVEEHPVLPLRVAVGAVGVLIASVVGSRFLVDALVRFETGRSLVYVAISVVTGYGPSVWWCLYASRRWGAVGWSPISGCGSAGPTPDGVRSCGSPRSVASS